MFGDPSSIDVRLDSRAVTFENPTGERAAGGSVANGRKGAPSRLLRRDERAVLADLEGPGTIRHIWCTIPPAPPDEMRAVILEVFYDGAAEPSVSVPLLDFFAITCGRPRPFSSALATAQEGRGFNAYYPMPFHERVRFEVHNGSNRRVMLYFQIDYTLGEASPDAGVLHVSFRRENPTTLREDFTIANDVRGPGRYLGCAVGIRTIDAGRWYGEGEVKIYRDGDDAATARPTICGTGLEDYVGSAWGMGAHDAPFGGAPLDLRAPGGTSGMNGVPDFVGFYRWHVPDPVIFLESLRVTIQQIGMHLFLDGQESERDAYLATNPLAGNGWFEPKPPGVCGMGLFERVDDYSAAAFVYCRDVQAVPRVDVEVARADLARRDYEVADPFEGMLG
jgi:hypothetical protein